MNPEQVAPPLWARRVVRACALLAGAFAFVSLWSWCVSCWELLTLAHAPMPMAPTTALAILALAAAAYLQSRMPGTGTARRAALMAAAVALGFSSMALVRVFAGAVLLPEAWLAGAPSAVSRVPVGFMPAATAVALILVAASLALVVAGAQPSRLRRSAAGALAGASVLLVLIALTGHLRAASLASGPPGASMAASTLASLALLACACAVAAWAGGCAQGGSDMPAGAETGPASDMTALLTAGLMVLAIAGVGGYLLRGELQRARQHAQEEIGAIAALKSEQLVRWREDRLAEARVLSRDPRVAQAVAAFLSDPQDEARGAALRRWLGFSVEPYAAAGVYDPARRAIWPVGAEDRTHGREIPAAMAAGLEAAEPGLVDFHCDGAGDTPHLDVICPIRRYDPAQGAAGGECLGALVLRVDPAEFLYPLIQSWPTPSPTAETLLVRREGEEVVFLNDLRHRPGAALGLRLEIPAQPELPAAMVASGREGMVEGADYRGVRVLADVHAVPGAPWFLVAKVDLDEVRAPLQMQAWITLGLLAALSLAALLLVRTVQGRREVALVHEELQARQRAEAALAQERTILRNILEDTLSGYWDWDLEANTEYLSPMFKRMFGYEDHELPNRPETWQRLIFPEDLPGVMEVFRQHTESRGRIPFYNEVRYRHKDGSTVWVICAGRVVEWDAAGAPKRIVGCHVNITSLKRAEAAMREREEDLAVTLASIGDGVIATDTAGRVTRLNAVAETLTGWTAAEAQGRPLAEVFCIVNEETRAAVESPVAKVMATGLVVGLANHTLLVARDGTERPIADSGAPIRDAQNRVRGVVLVFRDQTEERRAERALRDQEACYRELFENMASGVAVYEVRGNGEDFVFKAFNRAAERMDKQPREELIGRSLRAARPGAEAFGLLEVLRRVWETGTPEHFPVRLYQDQALAGWYDNYVYKLPTGDLVAIFEDVTAQKHLEDEREVTVRLLGQLNRANDLHAAMRSVTALLQEWSGCEAVGIRLRQGEDYPYFETRGFPAEFVQAENQLCARDLQGQLVRDEVGSPVLECMCGNVLCGRFDPALPFFTAFGSFWSNGTSALLASTSEKERQARTRNRCNGEGYESVALIPLKGPDGNLGLLQLNDRRANMFRPERIALLERLATSIALALAQKQARKDLEESEQYLRRILDRMNDAFYIHDFSGRILDCNENACRMLGRSREELVSLAMIDSPEEAGRMPERMARLVEQGWVIFDGEHVHADGSRIPVNVSGRIVSREGAGLVQSFVRDMREVHELQERLRQAEKLTAIGQLAGGVAHDFNNQLAAILGYAEILQTRLEDVNLNRYAVNILTAARRSADLVKQLLAFGRKGKYRNVRVDVHEVLREVVEILQRSIDKRIRIDTQLHARPSVIRGDPSQVQSALLNLALNARDSMPEGGELVFTTEVVDLDEAFCRADAGELQPGRYLKTSLVDSGCGMSPEVLKHCFEPFFTTKEVGKGTGLGLASVYGTVRSHHGTIEIRSEEGHGTIVRVYLPLVEAGEALAAGTRADAARAAAATARVLAVDDEDLVRGILAEMLEAAGYAVATRASGTEAVEYYREHSREIDLVIVDMMMPGMDGHETFRALRAINPDVRVLMASGHSLDDSIQATLREGVCGFLTKPFDQRELNAAVTAALGDRQA